MIRRSLALAAAAVGMTAIAEPALAQANEQFLPSLVYRTGAYAPNGIPFANGVADYWTLHQRARRRHQRRQDRLRGMRDRLRHRQGRGVLRAPQGQGPDRRRLLLAAVHRHHLRADREGARRQDPAADAWATAAPKAATAPCSPGTSSPLGSYWTAADIAIQHIAKELGGVDKLKGKKISLVYHDSPYGKEPIPALRGARQEERLRVQGHSGHASGRRAEVAVAGDPPGPARLRAALGLGRDELHRHQGSRRRRLSARQDDRRVVVGRRA